jgi:hypothetical protein
VGKGDDVGSSVPHSWLSVVICRVCLSDPDLPEMDWGGGRGDGTWTDEAMIAARKVQSASPFFSQVLKEKFANRLSIGNHIYPPSVSTQTVK